MDHLTVKRGEHPAAGNDQKLIAAATAITARAVDKHSRWSGSWAKVQMHGLVSGAALYLTWHVLEMAIRADFDPIAIMCR